MKCKLTFLGHRVLCCMVKISYCLYKRKFIEFEIFMVNSHPVEYESGCRNSYICH